MSDLAIFTIPELSVPIRFRRRPISIPADLRPHWIVAIILLILWKSSRGAKSSLQKLHVLSWAIRTGRRRAALWGFITGEFSPQDILVRYEPGLDRAIKLAAAEGLIEISNHNQVQLTPKGSNAVQQIEQMEGCLVEESSFLEQLGTRLTEKQVKALVRMESTP
jgi:hypothetical protein